MFPTAMYLKQRIVLHSGCLFRVIMRFRTTGQNISNLIQSVGLTGGMLLLTLILARCKFTSVQQPAGAKTGDTIAVYLTVKEDYAETTNAHKGLIGVLVPEDWTFISGTYSSSVGSGNLEYSSNWTDSAEIYYPVGEYGDNLKWIVVLSDSGYMYSDLPSADVTLLLNTGTLEGCFKMAYIATKATTGLLGTGWTAFSYPHAIGIPDSTACEGSDTTTLKTERAPDWDDLFNRTSGWTGADGIYSIPLSGCDIFRDDSLQKTLFLFSDTFIGSVNSEGKRVNSKLVNNTLALLTGYEPSDEKTEFTWGETASGTPTAVFIPDTPESASGDWYWLMDGIAIGDTVYIYGMRLSPSSTSSLGWEISGVALISFAVDDDFNIFDVKQVDTPFLYNASDGTQTIIGQAIMPMTEESGNPNADGFLYVYGPRSGSVSREMVVSRVLPQNITDFSQYRYWNGNDWVADIAECEALTNSISMEFSVTPLADGRYICVFQLNTVSRSVAVRFGDSPTGPFGYYQLIWDCTESDSNPNIIMYNAKAHPHLSNHGELLISYNVNSFNYDSFTYVDIYRPRFITLTYDDQSGVIYCHSKVVPEQYTLLQNYPNPFNATTRLTYQLSQTSDITLNIYDLTGRLVRTLVQNRAAAGTYQVFWNGVDSIGRPLPSGIYFARIQIQTTNRQMLTETCKLMLLK